jgi:hypothetical protein
LMINIQQTLSTKKGRQFQSSEANWAMTHFDTPNTGIFHIAAVDKSCPGVTLQPFVKWTFFSPYIK